MANTEANNTSEHAKESEGVNEVQEATCEDQVANRTADAKQATPVASRPASRDASPALASPGSGLTPLRGSSSSTAPTLNMPHPKRFSSVDINKRFLEKNSQVASASHVPTTSVSKTPSSIRTLFISFRCKAI
jgi:hypothetical protein